MVTAPVGSQNNLSRFPGHGDLETDTGQGQHVLHLIVLRLVGDEIPLLHPALCLGVMDFLQGNIDIFRKTGQDRPGTHSPVCLQGDYPGEGQSRRDDGKARICLILAVFIIDLREVYHLRKHV